MTGRCMTPKEFLSLIWAKQGRKCLVEVVPPTKKYPKAYFKHFFYPSTEAALEAIEQFTDSKRSIYHACSTFQNDARTQAESLAIKTFWADLDCGEGKAYPNQKDAIVALGKFKAAMNLPTPMIVSSGNGIHAYWVLEEEINSAEWSRTAVQFKQVCRHLKFHADPSRTSDSASILRPVGSKNFKDPKNPKDVVVLKAMTPMPYADFKQSITNYLESNEIIPELPLAKTQGLNGDLSGGQEYPPSSAHQIADGCAQVRLMRDTRGDIEEPLWYACIGVLKHTMEGEPLIHEWSKGYKGYDKDETDRKIIQWTIGPATCQRLESLNPGACEGCAKRGEINSPISLGYNAAPPVEASTVVNVETGEVEFEFPADMTSLYRIWHGQLVGEKIKQEEDETTGKVASYKSWEPFSDTVFYPIGYHNSESGYALHMRVPAQHDKPARDFELLCSDIGQGGSKLFGALGAAQIVALNGEKKAMEAYLTKWHDSVKKAVEEMQQYNHFGWQEDGSFLLGTRLYQPSGAVKDVLLDNNPLRHAGAFSKQGDIKSWREIVNTAYNYEGQEQYQFILCASLGSALVGLYGDYAGSVINMYSSKSGFGKTSIERAAMSVWSKPNLILSQKQTTWNALLTNVGTFHSLPVCVDEFTNTTPQDISDFVYAVSQGKSKDRLTQTGELRNNASGWATLVITSANRSMVSTVAAGKSNPEAEIARVLEIHFEMVSKMDRKQAAELLRRLNECHGVVGDAFARWIVVPKNKEYARELMLKVQAHLDQRANLTAVHRFWSQACAAIIAAGIISKQLGFIDFDMKGLTQWTVRKLMTMADTAEENTMSLTEMFGQMLTDLAPSILVTDTWGDMRSGKPAYVIETPKHAVAGRVVQETNELFISCTAIRRWCKDSQGDYQGMLNAVQAAGWASAESVNRTLTKGTSIPSSPVRCWKLNPALISGEAPVSNSVRQLNLLTKEQSSVNAA